MLCSKWIKALALLLAALLVTVGIAGVALTPIIVSLFTVVFLQN